MTYIIFYGKQCEAPYRTCFLAFSDASVLSDAKREMWRWQIYACMRPSLGCPPSSEKNQLCAEIALERREIAIDVLASCVVHNSSAQHARGQTGF